MKTYASVILFVTMILVVVAVAIDCKREAPAPSASPLKAAPAGANYPAALLVPNWYIDPSNTTTCASDGNTCTSATCGAAGSNVGPCVTCSQIMQRLQNAAVQAGLSRPALPQTTVVTQLSTETFGQENCIIDLRTVNNGNFQWQGVPTASGSTFAAGAVTAKVQTSTGNALQIATVPSQVVVGSLIFNVSKNSWATVDSVAASVATMTQPLAAASLTTVTNSPTITEDNTWTTGDTLQVYTQVMLNLKSPINIEQGDANNSNGNVAYFYGIRVPDALGANVAGQSSTVIENDKNNYNFANTRFDTTVRTKDNCYTATYFIGDWLNGGGRYFFSEVIAGATATSAGNNELINESAYDADVIVHSSTNVKGRYVIFGNVFLTANVIVDHGGVVVEEPDFLSSAPVVYGNTTIDLFGPNSAWYNNSGNTWANSLKVTTLEMDNITTGTAYASGVFTDGITITSAALDTNHGLQDVRTGSRYAQLTPP